jgi:tripartite-type tricarboxylate transporter receptor subunit TctC
LSPATSLTLCTTIVLAGMATGGIDRVEAQDSVAQFYRGKTINFVIGANIGGGNDAYARLLARHIGSHIPGAPLVVAQNMPGAGSNKAAAYLYSQASKDGTAIGAIQPGAILQPLLSGQKAAHDPSRFNFLGNANNEINLCIARSDAPAKTFRDTFTHEVIMGASADAALPRDIPAMLNNVLGTRLRVIAGYAGSREVMIAVERNEVQGMCGISWASLSMQHSDWIDSGFITILEQDDTKGHPDLVSKGIPVAINFAKSVEDRQVMELIYSQNLYGRPFIIPPGVPRDRVAALRKAFMDAMRDSDLLAEAKKNRLDIDPTSGEDLQALISRLSLLPPAIIERARQSLVYKAPAR